MHSIQGFPDAPIAGLPGSSLLKFVSDINKGYPGEFLYMLASLAGLVVAAFGAVDLFMFDAEYGWALLPVGLVLLVASIAMSSVQKRKGPLWVRILRDPSRIQSVRMVQYVNKHTQQNGGSDVELVHALGKTKVMTMHVGAQFMQAVSQLAPHAF